MPSVQAQLSTAETASHPAAAPAQAAAAPQLGVQTLPSALAFVPAGGRGHNDDFRFEVRGAHGTLFLTPRETVFALPTSFPPRQVASPDDDHRPRQQAMAIVRQRFVGAAPHPKVSGLELQPGVVNEYLGERPEDWRTQLPSYGAVQYYAVYPGIHLRYDGTDGQLKRSFLLAPGADASAIQWQYQGVDGMQLTATGDMQLQITVRLSKAQQDALDTPTRTMPITMTERAPQAWQDTPQGRVAVPVQFVLANGHKVQFALGAYDHGLPLVIDPAILYDQAFGGTRSEQLNDMELDQDGQVIMVGYTGSPDFGSLSYGQHTVLGATYAFASALNPQTGNLLWTTRLGDNDKDSSAHAVTRSSATSGPLAHTLVMSGITKGSYPVTTGSCPGAAVTLTRLNSTTGTRLAASCLSSGNSAGTFGDTAVGHTHDDQLWLGVNYTGPSYQAWIFPATATQRVSHAGGSQTPSHIYIVRVSSDMSTVELSVALGGAADIMKDLVVDASNRPVVVGKAAATLGQNIVPLFPTTDRAIQRNSVQTYAYNVADIFASRLTWEGALEYSTLLSGTHADEPEAVALAPDGQWVLGGTSSPASGQTAPVTGQAWSTRGTIYVARINPELSGLVGLTYASMLGNGIAQRVAATNDSILVGGTTNDPDLFAGVPPLQGFAGGFIAQLDTTQKALRLASYITASDQRGLVLTPEQDILVGGVRGSYTAAQLFLSRIGELPVAIPPQAPNPPKYTTSYYIQSFDVNVAFKMGCLARKNNAEGVIVLDFGNAWQWGEDSFGVQLIQMQDDDQTKKPKPPVQGRMADIQQATLHFIDGYAKAPLCNQRYPTMAITETTAYAPLTVAVGISNAPYPGTKKAINPALKREHGMAWGQMVLDLQITSKMLHYNNINVMGAFDAEPGWWALTGGFAPTEAWARGFMSVDQESQRYGLSYYNFGSLDGQWRDSAWQVVENPGYADVYTINRGIPGARALPQIYHSDYAKEWYQFRSYTIIRNLKPIELAGTMTECLSSSSVCVANIETKAPWAQAQLDLLNNQGKREELGPYQGWMSMWDTFHRTLMQSFALPAALPPGSTGWLTLPPKTHQPSPNPTPADIYKQLTFPPNTASCRPVAYLYGYTAASGLLEPNNRLDPNLSCYPAGTLLPEDLTFPSEFLFPPGAQPLFNPLTPQTLPWATDIGWGFTN